MTAMRDEKPLLQFKSERHAECLPCCGKLRRCNPDLSASDAKAAYAKKLAEDDESYLLHMSDLEAYEESIKSNPSKKRRTSGSQQKALS